VDTAVKDVSRREIVEGDVIAQWHAQKQRQADEEEQGEREPARQFHPGEKKDRS
jgi:hypothetical protein